MGLALDIGSLIVSTPEVRHGRPRIAGTGITVHRIARWHNLGLAPEEIVAKYGHLTLAQVHAALAYCHANRSQIDSDLAAEEAEEENILDRHRRGLTDDA